MRRFKNILAVYGDNIGADDVVDRAEKLAHSNNANLTLIEVLPERYTSLAERADKLKRLTRVARGLRKTGVKCLVVIGTPFLDIIKTVLRQGHDLVIVAADSGSTLKNLYFGSTPKHLMRKCPCPVWVVKPGQAHSANKILACVDPESNNPEDNQLDVKILEFAISLARTKNSELHVINAWDVEGKDRDTVRSEVHDKDYLRILNNHEGTHRIRVAGLINADMVSDISYQLHFPRSSPEKAILNLVRRQGIELVVMGTVSRTGVSGFLIGNSAEIILSSVRCSVFTVKPEGFDCPVILEREQDAMSA